MPLITAKGSTVASYVPQAQKYESESTTIKASELHEYTHNERRSFDHLAS